MDEPKNGLLIVHVPQGRSARFMRATIPYGIEGLHTDGFSTCNIIICMGNDKITLTHADLRTNPEIIKEQIMWVGEPNETIIIARENILLNQLLPHLQKILPGRNFITKQMDKKHDGIVVTFNSNPENDIHRQINKIPIGERPKNLLHHPSEEKFLAVQKIEQVIGLRAAFTTQKFRNYQQLIFDGRAWEPIDDNEFNIRLNHKMTREEYEFFKPSDTRTTIAGKLMGVIQNAQQKIELHGDIKELADSVAFYLEGYLNKFDALMLYKRNIKETLTCADYSPNSDDDRKFKEDVLVILQEKHRDFDMIHSIFAEYKQKSPQTEFKKNVVSEFEQFAKDYHSRMMYRQNESFQQEQLRLLGVANNIAVSHYRAKEFSAASNIFFEILKKATLCCLKSSEELVTAYYNFGRSLQQEFKYNEARFFINTARILRESYVKSNQAELEKVKKALAECESQIEKQKVATYVSEAKPVP